MGTGLKIAITSTNVTFSELDGSTKSLQKQMLDSKLRSLSTDDVNRSYIIKRVKNYSIRNLS